MLGVSTKSLGNIASICLRGKIIIGETGALRKVLERQSRSSVIVLDLERVTAIDAHGLGVLLQLRDQAESKGIEFRLMNVTQLVARVLEVTKLNSVFEVATKPEELSRKPLGRSFSMKELAACA